MDITTQDPLPRGQFGVDKVIGRLASFLEVSAEELKDFARLTGNDDVHKLAITDLCTTNA